MSKMRKFLAVAVAVTMMTAFLIPVAQAAVYETDRDGTGTVQVFDIDLDFEVTLPTAASLNFILDPDGYYGLYSSLEVGDTANLDDLADFAGGIVFQHGAPVILNESGFQLNTEIGIAVTATGSGADVTAVAATGIAANTSNNVAFTVTASAMNVTDVDAGPDDFFGYMSVPFGKASDAVTNIAPVWLLDDADYILTKTAGGLDLAMVPDTGHGTQLLFAGICNETADWSDFTDSDSSATAAVVTYGGLATLLGAMTADEAIITIGGVGYEKVTSASGPTEFEDATGLIALLNDAFDDIWTFSISSADVLATADNVGPIATHTPPTVAPGNAVVTGDTTTANNQTITGALVNGLAEGAGDPITATKSVGIKLSFRYDDIANAGDASSTVLAEPGTAVAGGYGLRTVGGLSWTGTAPAYGFQTGTGMSLISNVPFMDGVIPYRGEATFTYETGFTESAEPKILFTFDDDDAAFVSFWYFGGGTIWYDVTDDAVADAAGLVLSSDGAFAGVEEGEWVFVIYTEDTEGTISYWKVNAVVTDS